MTERRRRGADGRSGVVPARLLGGGRVEWGTPPEPLPASFYEPSAERVARALLGHWLVRRTPDGGWAGGVMVETEGYLQNDPACHAAAGMTARNRSMFGPGGRAYLYFIYGNHWCFNAVCGPEGMGEAVLIRAIEPTVGASWMRSNRPGRGLRELTSGPGKCCQALALDRAQDGLDLTRAESGVYLGFNPRRAAWVRRAGPVVAGPRIGIREAADWPLRFYLPGSPWVSRL